MSEDTPVPKESSLPASDDAGASGPVVSDPELDALLDDALLDFDKPLPEIKRPQATEGDAIKNPEMNQIWSEEFIKEATAQFEKKIRSLCQAPGSSAEALPKIVEAATRAAVGETASPSLAASLSETVKNLAANADLDNPIGFNDDELSKLMNSFALGDGALDNDMDNMDEILPFMTNMMQKLLSKELLQPVLTDIVDRYPDWLADNREKLSAKDFDKYNLQYENMKQICEEYAKEKDSDTEEVKQKRFDKISDLMLKIQHAGPPPKELVGDMDSGSASLFNPGDMGLGSSDQCSIM